MVTEVSENTFEEWYKEALDAVEHRDAGLAYRILHTMDDFVASLNSGVRDDEEFRQEMAVARRNLRFVAFPELSLDEACRILSSESLSFIGSGLSFDDQLSVRYDFTAYGEHEDERVALKKAILSNTEKIGPLGIGEWLQLFDTLFDPETREDRSILDFFTKEPRIAELSRRDQQMLRSILDAYEHWIAVRRLNLIDLATAYGQGMKEIGSKIGKTESSEPRELSVAYKGGQSSREDKNQSRILNESLPLLKALGKFEKLGGQQVTNSKIVVKGQNDPVRPTIFNWLRAYRDELGVGAHDSVTRGQFLFHSLNGKGLTSDERDQVGMLLKSIDENSPLAIDAGRQEVVFTKQLTINSQQLTTSNQQITNNREQLTGNREQIQNTKYQIQNTASLPTQNISRAVFELPHISQPSSAKASDGQSREPIQNTNQGIPSAFEQAKAIQAAARENQISMAKVASETVELGRVNAFPSAPPMTPRPRIEPAPQNTAPAPRAISFEPAKIDTFSFGAGRQNTFQTADVPNRTSVVPPARNDSRSDSGRPAGGASVVRTQGIENIGLTAPKAERPMFANGNNVGELSFSTKHVMPAEKEINSQQVTNNREQTTESDSNSGRTAKIAERPLQTQTADAPARGGQAAQAIVQPVPTQKPPVAPVVPIPPIQKPVMPVNRFRITPTGRRDSAPSDATPSPHVVDLRG